MDRHVGRQNISQQSGHRWGFSVNTLEDTKCNVPCQLVYFGMPKMISYDKIWRSTR